jgi:glycosyltransferase involved in cell wall biosynthesis
VVDDASTDRTAEIARSRDVRVIAVDLRHIAAVRNAGAAAANGDVFIFIDADTIVNARVVAAALGAIESGAVGGGALLDWDRLPFWGRALAAGLTVSQIATKLAAGCFVFCTRNAFTAVGGFDERVFVTEEWFLSRALRRHGRFVILRQRVNTSGRKLRTFSMLEFFRMTMAVLPRGFAGLRDRRHLGLWYGDRRPDDEGS